MYKESSQQSIFFQGAHAMPDVFYNEIKSITQPARLTAITTYTNKVRVMVVNLDGSCVYLPPKIETKKEEIWTVRAIVDVEWVGVSEREFSFPSEDACTVIQPGLKTVLMGEELP